MPSINTGFDNSLGRFSQAIWDLACGPRTGTSANQGLFVLRSANSALDSFGCARVFIQYDVRGITSAPSAAELRLNITGDADEPFYLVKGDRLLTDQDQPVQSFGRLEGYSNTKASLRANGVTLYSGLITPSGTGLVTISLNATALSDLASLDHINFVAVGADDYTGTSPTAAVNSITQFSTFADATASNRPRLSYTFADNSNRAKLRRKRRRKTRGSARGFSTTKVEAPSGGKTVSNGFKTNGF